MRRIAVAAAVTLIAALGSTVAALPATAAITPAAAIPAAVKPERPLNSISCPATTLCLAVGLDARTNHATAETFNGSRWSLTELPLPAGEKLAALASISCPTKTRCVAVGQSAASFAFPTNRLYAETWNGRSWTRLGGVPAPAGAHGAAFSGVSCVSATSCVLTGIYIPSPGAAIVSFADVLSAGKWHLYKLPGLTAGNSIVENVSCTAATHCVAVGDTGTARKSPLGTPAAAIIADTWNGRSWSAAKLPMPSGGRGAWVYDVSCSSATSCFATGGQNLAGGVSGVFAERIISGKWHITGYPGGNGTDSSLYGISCPTAAMCMATGGGELPSNGNIGFADSWAGAGWLQWGEISPGGNSSILTSVSCPTATHCVAVGLYGDTNGTNYTDLFGYAEVWNGSNWRLAVTP
jgi:hypothetical protein